MKSKTIRFAAHPLLATSLLALAYCGSSRAATISWDGSNSTAWTLGANWVGDVAPSNSITADIALFDQAAYPNQPNAGTTSITGIQIGDGATATGSLTLAGTMLNIGASGIDMKANAGAATISSPITLGAAQTWQNAAASLLAISGAVTNGGYLLTIGGIGNTAIYGAIGGSGGLTKSGAGKLTLSGANTYSGVTTISAGTLQFAKQTSLYNNNTASWTTTNMVVEFGATAAFNVGGSNEFTSANIDTLKALGSGVGGFKSGSFLGLDTTNGNFSYNSTIANPNGGSNVLGLVKLGSGTLTLGSTGNTYSGGTTVNGGTLTLNTGGAAGSIRGALTINSGAVVNASTSWSLGYNDNSTAVTTIAINGGTLNFTGTLGAGGTSASSITMTGGAISGTGFDWYTNGGASVTRTVTTFASFTTATISSGINLRLYTGELKFDVAQGTTPDGVDLLVSGVIQNGSGQTGASVTKDGAGRAVLTASNSYTGGTKISAGALAFNSGSLGSSGAITMNGGTLQWATGNTQDVSSRLTMVTGKTATLDTNGNNVAIASAIGGNLNASLAKIGTGTLTFTNANTYTGATTVSNGSLLLNAGSLNASSAVSVASTATFGGKGSAGAVSVTGGTIQGGYADVGNLSLTSLVFAGSSALNLMPVTGATASVAVSGAVTTSGTQTINITSSNPLGVGSYRLISWGSIAGSGNGAFSLGSTPAPSGTVRPRSYTLDTTPANYIGLIVSGDAPIWTGSTSGVWDTTTANNWVLASNGTTPTTYYDADVVQFNNTTGTRNITISGADVTPVSVAFNNGAGNDYTLGGSNGIAGSASLSKSGAGALTINSVCRYTGSTTINAGTLEIGGSGKLGNGNYAGAITNNAAFIYSSSADQILSGAISGSGSLTKSGAATLTLSGTNGYTGATTINGGTLAIGAAANLPSGSALTLSNGSTLNLTAGMTFANNVTIASGQAGTLKQTGAFSSVLTGNYSGVSGALTLDVSGGNNSGFSFDSANGPALGSVVNVIGASGTNQVYCNPNSNAAQTFFANAKVSVTATGSGTTHFFLGNVANGRNVQFGALDGGNATTLIDSDNEQTTLTVNGVANANFAGVIANGGGTNPMITLVKTGGATQILSGNNSYTGATTISGGTLEIGGSGKLGNGSYAASITNNAAFVYSSSAAQTLSGAIGGTGALTKSGASTLTLSGTNSYSGATTVNAGKLVVSGSVSNSAVTVNSAGTTLACGTTGAIGSSVTLNAGAILAVGDAAAAGTATVGGATTFNNGSIFSWDINSSGTSYDKLISASLVDGDTAGASVFRIVAADSSFANSFWSHTQTWSDIFTTNGTAAIGNWANIFTSVAVVDSSFTPIAPAGGSFALSGNTLTWSAVPEPTSALAGFLLGAGLLRRRRR